VLANRCLTIALLLISFISVACAKHSAVNPVNNGELPIDTTDNTALFKKLMPFPLFDIGADKPAWRSIHTANVSILSPDETVDSTWRLFMRGSGNNAGGYHDNIGTFYQSAEHFNPVGPWIDLTNNPTLTHGTSGTYDAQHVLDAAAVTGTDKQVFLYYMSRNRDNRAALCIASSIDGGATFKKYNNPLKEDVGPNDAVFYNNQYYLFYGDGKWNGSGFDEPLQIWLSVSSSATDMSANPVYALQVGNFGAFDSYSVNGAKIFKVSGDTRWFMLYQCSRKNFDYPERFHCAYSNDLVHWTKVNNTRSLLTRGNIGEFDQGAIWTGSVIEDKGILYIYYEGWGSFSRDEAKRDTPYYAGGNSRVGIASCTTADFLKWVNN